MKRRSTSGGVRGATENPDFPLHEGNQFADGQQRNLLLQELQEAQRIENERRTLLAEQV